MGTKFLEILNILLIKYKEFFHLKSFINLKNNLFIFKFYSKYKIFKIIQNY